MFSAKRATTVGALLQAWPIAVVTGLMIAITLGTFTRLAQTGEKLVGRRLNCHITKQAKREFYLLRQVQFAEQFRVDSTSFCAFRQNYSG
jgi:hypothetical protein